MSHPLRRRLPAVTLAVGLCLAAVGCSNSTGQGASPTSSAALSGAITVRAAGGEGEIKAVRALADAFVAANPGTSVNLVSVAGAGELIAKLTTEFTAHTPPDVFILNYRRLGDFATRNVIEPVAGVDISGLYPRTVEAFTFDGKLLCLPSNASSMVVYYNPTLFARAGVPTPKADWTWADMRAAAKALAAKGIEAFGFETALIRLAPFVWSAGGEIVDNPIAPTRVDLDNAGARAALSYLLELQTYGLDATERAAQDPEATFGAGKLGMYLDSRRAVPGFRKTVGLTFDVAPVPLKNSQVSVLHSDGYCVSKNAKNPAVARAFAQYAVTGAGATSLAETGRTVPAAIRLSTADAFLAPTKQPKSSKIFLDQLPAVRALPHVAGWNEAEEATEEVLAQLFAGRVSLDTAIEDIAKRTQRALAKA